jgi:GWxTD domain-containing protein
MLLSRSFVMTKTSAFRPTARLAALLLFLGLGIAAGCALYHMERDLPEKYATFLSDVRYLITGAERKTFLYTPDAAKDRFIEDFWLRRDPDPETPENVVKNEYYDRIRKANEFFRTEGTKGWLTDRGRIYVLFGPPNEQKVLTIAQTGGSGCREVWYYEGFPVVFVDETCVGAYRLATIDLMPIKNLSLDQPPAKIGPESPGRPGGFTDSFSRGARPILDFTAEIRGTVRRADRVEGLLHLEIPLRVIWFKSENGRFLTTFDVAVKVKDVSGAVVWEKTASAEASYPEREITLRSEGVHTVEIPILIEAGEAVDKIRDAPVSVEIKLKNNTGSETVTKTIAWD